MNVKMCTKCGLTLPVDQMIWRKGKPSTRCKPCHSADSKEWRDRNPERSREYTKKWLEENRERVRMRAREARQREGDTRKKRLRAWKYGLTPAQLDALIESSTGMCQICGVEEIFAVDHDHSCCSGVKACLKCVRGALCRGCNLGLGGFRDNPETLAKAIVYLGRRTTE